MLQDIKKMYVGEKFPDTKDLKDCISYAKSNRCIIELVWFLQNEKYYKSIYITGTSNIQNLTEDINNQKQIYSI